MCRHADVGLLVYVQKRLCIQKSTYGFTIQMEIAARRRFGYNHTHDSVKCQT